MAHISGFARDQLLLLPEAVDDYVDAENPVRFIDAFVDGLDALKFARSGDTLIVWKLDRLARSMKQLIETVETLRTRCIGLRSLTEALDTTTAARDAGRTGGRPPKLADNDIEAAKAMLANPDIGVTQIAHRLGVSPATLYRYIPAARTANTPDV
jgi:DNA invertase Pin-like site-specific DNA recombinase